MSQELTFLYDSLGRELMMRVGSEAEEESTDPAAATHGNGTNSDYGDPNWSLNLVASRLELDSTLMKETGENVVLHLS